MVTMVKPVQRKDKRCYIKECRKQLPRLAATYADPFCSTECAKRYYGVVNATERGRETPIETGHINRNNVILALRKHGPLTAAQLECIVGIKHHAIGRHLRNLQDEGIVGMIRSGQTIHYVA